PYCDRIEAEKSLRGVLTINGKTEYGALVLKCTEFRANEVHFGSNTERSFIDPRLEARARVIQWCCSFSLFCYRFAFFTILLTDTRPALDRRRFVDTTVLRIMKSFLPKRWAETKEKTGVRKGGTRALLEFLNIHPAVQKASDEVHFFDDDSKYEMGLEWYRRQMPYSFPEQVTIEKSPAYFVTESTPYRIHAMNSSVKLILIVRDPVTRLISDYAQLAENKAKKERRVASFEEVVLFPDGSVNTNYKPVRTSIYSLYYTRWIQVFPPHQIHIVDGDRLVYDPFPEVQKVEMFLGLNHKISRENFSYNATKGFYCVKLNGTAEKCLNESKGRPHPDVDPAVVQTLRRFYSPFNRKFYKMVQKDFGWPEF
ncbi:heparan sulfate glucosamine 3-O-sulfotransferase 5-like protein, partial [Dinothrombium tinctorium]